MFKRFLLTLTLIFLLIILLGIPGLAFPEGKNGFSLDFNLEFFNKFNNSQTGIFTEAFQRYHTFGISYSQNEWHWRMTYNWYDKVDSNQSIHTITPWSLELSRKITEETWLTANYIWVTDLVGVDNSQLVALNVISKIKAKDQFEILLKAGGRYVADQFIPVLGGCIGYSHYFLGVNYLTATDEHLLLERRDEFYRIPITLGVDFKLNEKVNLTFNLNHLLIPSNSGDCNNTWLQSGLKFKLN